MRDLKAVKDEKAVLRAQDDSHVALKNVPPLPGEQQKSELFGDPFYVRHGQEVV